MVAEHFEYGTWGGELHPGFEPRPGDIVAQEHWCSSGFANTDLDLLLKKHGIHQLIVMGLVAHTCLEATVRYGAELGYEVTVVKDATASYSEIGRCTRRWKSISRTTPAPFSPPTKPSRRLPRWAAKVRCAQAGPSAPLTSGVCAGRCVCAEGGDTPMRLRRGRTLKAVDTQSMYREAGDSAVAPSLSVCASRTRR